MSQQILVTWQNPKFLEKTYNKGEKGLGDGYTIDPKYPYQVVFTVDELNRLQEQFVDLIKIYSGFNGNDISNYFRESGESLSGAMVRQLKRELNRILFNDKLTNVYSYFPFSDKLAASQSKTNVMKYMLSILESYRDITQRVLNRESGLAEYPASVTPDTLPQLIEVPESRTEVTVGVTLTITRLQIPLLESLIGAVNSSITTKASTFFDDTRELKTLLNLGNDRQVLVEAWRKSPSNPSAIQLKLLSALDAGVAVYDAAFISRELAKTVIDTVEFDLGPEADTTPYLRPMNTDVIKYIPNKRSLSEMTMETLGIATGSAGAIINGSQLSYSDTVFRRWFTSDFNSSELNIDFTDYNNFVYYGSAYNRLLSFKQKLLKIEELTSASISASVSSSVIGQSLKAIEKENIIRNFDGYEQFLYFATESFIYTASAYYTIPGVEYHATASWPKMPDGSPWSANSVTASNWLTVQGAIAQRYDDNNPNYLIKHLPSHIQENSESVEFLTLVAMVGHVMDNLKQYIDQFGNIYSTTPDPFEELTMDQVYEVAQSFGLKLPNAYSIENLESFVSSIAGETGSRSLVAETWKRFLHSAVYLAKTKGSRTSFDALLNTYGLNSPILQIKETTYPSSNNYIQSDELTYGLQYTGSTESYIQVPFVSASIATQTLQLRFNPTARVSSSIITGDDVWAVDLIPHPSSSKLDYGRLQVVSGSGRTVIATSSYFPLFSDDYTNIMLRSQSADISIIQADGDQILFQESASLNLGTLWNATTFVYVGGSGSIKLGNKFDGIIDEVRLWGENISDADFESQAYDPGSYYGTNYTSSRVNLYVHLPFSIPSASVTQSIVNESPYENIGLIPSVPAVGFTTASYERILRSIKQFTPIVGSTIYTNKKVNVVPPPVFSSNYIDGDGTYVLSLNNSIKVIEEKQYTSGQNVVSFAISPTDFINQTILRTMGVVDVNNIIGSPRYITGSSYPNLTELKNYFLTYYNEKINPNEYIRFFRDLVDAPSDYAEDMVPARAKLLNGIVIESSILDRNRSIVQPSVAVDGTATKTFNNYISGSGSTDVGAYTFEYSYPINIVPDLLSDTLPISGDLDVSDLVGPVSSTPPAAMPEFRRIRQYVNNILVTSSILDENSSFDTLEANSIDAKPLGDITSSGYPRNPYLGIPSRLSSEDNTLTPYYDIRPRADLTEIGTTSYFHKNNGQYYYEYDTLYKQLYVVKLDTDLSSPTNQVYAPVTLLQTGSIVAEPGRYDSSIPVATYASGSYNTGVIKMANLFSLYNVQAASGLRLRLYRDTNSRDSDRNRTFSTVPTGDHGVLFDGLLQQNSDVFPYVMMQTSDSNIYYSIDNLTAGSITTEIIFYYFAYEPTTLVPVGYLPRHYKFSRDNTTALKRRNYLGCRDVGTTFDGSSPIIVGPSVGNTIVVNSTNIPSQDINLPSVPQIRLGGGGRLSVQ
jgi:hypothetical protein